MITAEGLGRFKGRARAENARKVKDLGSDAMGLDKNTTETQHVFTNIPKPHLGSHQGNIGSLDSAWASLPTNHSSVADNGPLFFESCPSDIIEYVDQGVCRKMTTWTEPIGSADGIVINGPFGGIRGDSYPTGETYISYTATDTANNTTKKCEFSIAIKDKQPPVFG
jgi:hypothetical protein